MSRRAASKKGTGKLKRSAAKTGGNAPAPFTDETTPRWLQAALDRVKARKGAAPAWLSPASLPPVVVSGRRLNNKQVGGVLRALQQSTLAEEHPLVFALLEYGDRAALETFAWRLFERWLGKKAPARDRWAMTAVGLFGSDASAMKLGPMVRDWSAADLRRHAELGMECLKGIGTDVALLQLCGIARSAASPAIRERAAECIKNIAAEKGLSPAMLENLVAGNISFDR